jgi:putative flippase GtrA
MITIQHIKIVAKHLIVSGISAITELSFFYLLKVILETPLWFAHSLSFISATSVGFVMHSHFTFSIGRLRKRNALFFSVQASIALVLGFFILREMVNHEIPVMVAKFCQLCLTFFFNVLFGKFISFKK